MVLYMFFRLLTYFETHVTHFVFITFLESVKDHFSKSCGPEFRLIMHLLNFQNLNVYLLVCDCSTLVTSYCYLLGIHSLTSSGELQGCVDVPAGAAQQLLAPRCRRRFGAGRRARTTAHWQLLPFRRRQLLPFRRRQLLRGPRGRTGWQLLRELHLHTADTARGKRRAAGGDVHGRGEWHHASRDAANRVLRPPGVKQHVVL